MPSQLPAHEVVIESCVCCECVCVCARWQLVVAAFLSRNLSSASALALPGFVRIGRVTSRSGLTCRLCVYVYIYVSVLMIVIVLLVYILNESFCAFCHG